MGNQSDHFEHELDTLDALLVNVRAMMQRPGYRQYVLDHVDVPIDLSTLRVLRSLERSPTPTLSVTEIATVMAIDTSTASRMVDRCVEAGLVSRLPSVRDRRRFEIALTDRGREVLTEASTARRAILADVVRDWTSDELGSFLRSFQRLAAGFDRLEVHLASDD